MQEKGRRALLQYYEHTLHTTQLQSQDKVLGVRTFVSAELILMAVLVVRVCVGASRTCVDSAGESFVGASVSGVLWASCGRALGVLCAHVGRVLLVLFQRRSGRARRTGCGRLAH